MPVGVVACLRMCAYVHMWGVFTYVGSYEGQRLKVGRGLLRQGPSLNPEFPVSARTAGQWSAGLCQSLPAFIPLSPLTTPTQAPATTVGSFAWVPRMQIQILMFAVQALYPLSCISPPTNHIFKAKRQKDLKETICSKSKKHAQRFS